MSSFVVRFLVLMVCVGVAVSLFLSRADKDISPISENCKVKRVVSVAPSVTELVYALHREELLVGTCAFCEFPAAAKKLPKVGTFLEVNLETMKKLKPDLVLLIEGQEKNAAQLKKHGFKILVLKHHCLNDLISNIKQLGVVLEARPAADRMAVSLASSFSALRAIVATVPSRPSTLMCVWSSPIIAAGATSYLHDCISICGGINYAAQWRKDYPTLESEHLVHKTPATIIMNCDAPEKSMQKHPAWKCLLANRACRIVRLTAAEQECLSQPSLRMVDGLFAVAAAIHPERIDELRKWRGESQVFSTGKP